MGIFQRLPLNAWTRPIAQNPTQATAATPAIQRRTEKPRGDTINIANASPRQRNAPRPSAPNPSNACQAWKRTERLVRSTINKQRAGQRSRKVGQGAGGFRREPGRRRQEAWGRQRAVTSRPVIRPLAPLGWPRSRAGCTSSNRTSPSARGSDTIWKGETRTWATARPAAGQVLVDLHRQHVALDAGADDASVSKPADGRCPWNTAATIRDDEVDRRRRRCSGPACASHSARQLLVVCERSRARLPRCGWRRRGRWSGCPLAHLDLGTPARASPCRRRSGGSAPRPAGRSGRGPGPSSRSRSSSRSRPWRPAARRSSARHLRCSTTLPSSAITDVLIATRCATFGLVVVDLGEERQGVFAREVADRRSGAPAARP